jgi:hypothetical protein
MTFLDRVEAISDEFQSTFSVCPEGLANCLFESDLPAVETLVRKHFGAATVTFKRVQSLGANGYGIYVVGFTPGL